ncbi:MAG: acyl-CoA desaturase [Legionellales bacterium]|nr:acyl-CoA desaturase [Legionellales bacterium]|tara:strand:- start:625 stop:1806 length:1182 start_codon:yes stop_codon:yes gene_type:complete
MIFGFFDLPWWGYIVVILALTHITVAAVTLYLHRCQAHRSMDLHPVIAHFFRFWLWLTTGMVTKDWVSIHRKHHAKCETEDDPHSPQILGIKKVFFEGAELYREARKDHDSIERYGHGCPNDWLERNIYSKHSAKGVALLLIIDLLCFGVLGLTVWAIQMVWIPILAAGVINGIGHYWGYRNFECPDAARNVSPIAILACGEELHNNHHAYGSSAKFSVKWWEFDLGWMYIKILSAFKLAKVRKTIPELHAAPEKNSIDVETLKVFINNKLQVMSNYSKEVILPVLYEERNKVNQSSRKLFDKAKTLLIREDSIMSVEAKLKLRSFLAENSNVKLVYEFKNQLLSIWTKTTASQKELIEALHDWCKRAEATGVDSLKQFACSLKSYTLTLSRT